MPIYRITSPDGGEYEIDTGADEASEQDLISHVQAQPQQAPAKPPSDLSDLILHTPGGAFGVAATEFPARAIERTGGAMGRGWEALKRMLTPPTPGTGPSLQTLTNPLEALQLLPPVAGVIGAGEAALEVPARVAGGRLRANVPSLGELEWTPEEGAELGSILAGIAPVPTGVGAVGRTFRRTPGEVSLGQVQKALVPSGGARAVPETAPAPSAVTAGRFPQTEAALRIERAVGEFPAVRGLERAPEITGRQRGTPDEIVQFPQTEAALRIERRTGEFPEVRGPFPPIFGGAGIPAKASNADIMSVLHQQVGRAGATAERGTLGRRVELMEKLKQAGGDKEWVRVDPEDLRDLHALRQRGLVELDWEDATKAAKAGPQERQTLNRVAKWSVEAKTIEQPITGGADTVTVYRGGEGDFWTTNPQRAALYGDVTKVDVPRDVFEAGRVRARATGQPTPQDTVLPNEWAKKAKPAPGIKPQIHPIAGGAERFPSAAKTLTQEGRLALAARAEAETQAALRRFHEQIAQREAQTISASEAEAHFLGGRGDAPLGSEVDAAARTQAKTLDSMSDIIFGAWVDTRLLGKAQLKNFVYNNALLGAHLGDVTIEAARQAVRQALTGRKAVVTIGEARGMASAMKRAALKPEVTSLWSAITDSEAMQTAMDVWRGKPSRFGSTTKLERATTRFPELMKKIGFGQAGRLLLAADEWFKTVNFRGKAYGLLQREIHQRGGDLAWLKNPVEVAEVQGRIAKMAKTEAEIHTLTSKLPGAWEDFRRGTQDNKILRYAFPFMRTNINDLRMAMAHTPGFGALVKNMGDPEITKSSKQIMGFLSGLSIYWMTKIVGGKITGGGPIDPSGRNLSQTPYTIEIGDRPIQYDQMGTFGRMLSFMADAKDLWDNLDQDHIGVTTIKNMLGTITDQPGLEGMRRMSHILEGGPTAWAKEAQRMANVAPSGVGQLTTSLTGETYGLQARPQAPFYGIPQSALTPLPFLRGLVANPLLDIWGEPVQRDGFGNVQKWNNPLDQEMRRLAQSTGKGVMPPAKDIKDFPLNEEQYFKLKSRAGQLARTRMEAIVAKPSYQNASDERRISMVQQVFEDSRNRARGELLRTDRALREAVRNQIRQEVRKAKTPRAPGKALAARSNL